MFIQIANPCPENVENIYSTQKCLQEHPENQSFPRDLQVLCLELAIAKNGHKGNLRLGPPTKKWSATKMLSPTTKKIVIQPPWG